MKENSLKCCFIRSLQNLGKIAQSQAQSHSGHSVGISDSTHKHRGVNYNKACSTLLDSALGLWRLISIWRHSASTLMWLLSRLYLLSSALRGLFRLEHVHFHGQIHTLPSNPPTPPTPHLICRSNQHRIGFDFFEHVFKRDMKPADVNQRLISYLLHYRGEKLPHTCKRRPAALIIAPCLHQVSPSRL